ncbi:GntR family transcriptional regulator [Microbacterium foliorum]|uniref:GntR family transcriptional regulator n=1 Tax=Microbacterium foliorum TaxID=104336 RepID=UPI00286BB0DF|nr:GntR family transcriptional regulator [Microbacterium foliorum]
MPIPQQSPGVDRTLLRDDVFRRLRDAIVDCTFLPGEQLKDVDLAEWLGVSRTPVRAKRSCVSGRAGSWCRSPAGPPP